MLLTPPNKRRGFVIIMVIGVIALTTALAVTFLIMMRSSQQTATNRKRGVKAEFAARAGIEHAIAAINEAYAKSTANPPDYTSPDITSPIPDTLEILQSLSSPQEDGQRHWVDPSVPAKGDYAIYVTELDGRLNANLLCEVYSEEQEIAYQLIDAVLTGEIIPYDSADHPEAFVTIDDAAHRLLPPDSTASEAKTLRNLVRSRLTTYPTLKSITSTVSKIDNVKLNGTDVAYLYELELQKDSLTLSNVGYIVLTSEVNNPNAYFRAEIADKDTLNVYGNVTLSTNDSVTVYSSRPALNINAASEEAIAQVLGTIPSLATKAAELAGHICTARGNANFFNTRKEFEDLIRTACFDVNTDIALSELQFNDILNFTARSLAEEDSIYDEPGNPGVYSYDMRPEEWNNPAQWLGPSNNDGLHTVPDDLEDNTALDQYELPDGSVVRFISIEDPLNSPDAQQDNITHHVEFIFKTRFYMIYSLGRGREAGEYIGTKRFIAVYDAEERRIVSLYSPMTEYESVTDIIELSTP